MDVAVHALCPPLTDMFSSGSSGRVSGEGAEKNQIYAAAFGGHLFYDKFLQSRGRGLWPTLPPGSPTDVYYGQGPLKDERYDRHPPPSPNILFSCNFR